MMAQSEETNPDRPPPSITADTLKKIMWLYRTRNCPLNKRGSCHYGQRCFDSHESQPERRAPKQNEYEDWHPSTMKCTSNVPNENCKYGRACYFAHNDFEINYHPTMYKTKPCLQFEKEGTCKLGMICPNYHYQNEQRKIEKGSLAADCKSDGLSRKAPPPQEFRRWLDEELGRIAKANSNNNQLFTANGNKTVNHHHLNQSVKMVNHNNNKSQINHAHDTNTVIPTENKDININHNGMNSVDKVDIADMIDHKEIVDKIVGKDNSVSNNVSNHNLNHNNNVNNNNNDIVSNNNNDKNSNSKLNDRERSSQPNHKIENEVEIELPSQHSQPSQSLNISQPNLMLRNVTDSPTATRFNSSSPPFIPTQQQQQWQQKNNQSRPEHYLPSSSPHLGRALSTGSSLPSLPHGGHGGNLHYSHSHGHTLSTASFRSGRSGRSSGNRSQRSGKSGKSAKSKKSAKSVRSKSSKTSIKTKSSKSSKRSKKSISNKSHSRRRRGGHRSSRKKKSISSSSQSIASRKHKNKKDQFEKQAIELIKTYKINPCKKSKCNDIMCPNYHNFEDRRRSPYIHNYHGEACQRIFDAKTKKFTDNCYGCPMNENCEYAHNYLEIWYHPNVFHTKLCPILKYQKGCPWGFKCSHYHKKSQKRTIRPPVVHNNNTISHQQQFYQSQQQQLQQQQQQQQQHIMSGGAGPQRPPLSNSMNRLHHQSPTIVSHQSELSSPYSMVSFEASPHHQSQVQNLGNLGMVNPVNQENHHQIRNGLMSPNFDHNASKSSAHDTSYSFNPLMQGIAPSIHSWRQKNN